MCLRRIELDHHRLMDEYYAPDGLEIVQEMGDVKARLASAKAQYANALKARAKRDRDYRRELSIALARERRKGTPMTIIRDVVIGKDPILELRYLRDSSDAIVQANIEAINIDKLIFRSLQDMYRTEYTTGN